MREKIFRNFWAKVITLVLAIATWFYVFDLINRDFTTEYPVQDVFQQYDFVIRRFPVEPVFTGRSPSAYRARLDKVKIVPEEIHLFAPKKVLDQFTSVRTEKIDLGNYTRSIRITTSLTTDGDHIDFPPNMVDVYIPVERIDTQ